jgi:hypothetical protein
MRGATLALAFLLASFAPAGLAQQGGKTVTIDANASTARLNIGFGAGCG